MNEAIKDADDQAIIRAFHEAWRLTMRGLYERARRDGSDVFRLIEVERERMRNAILRAIPQMPSQGGSYVFAPTPQKAARSARCVKMACASASLSSTRATLIAFKISVCLRSLAMLERRGQHSNRGDA